MRAVDRIILAMNFILSAVFAGSVLLFVEQLTAGRAWFGHVVLAAPVLASFFVGLAVRTRERLQRALFVPACLLLGAAVWLLLRPAATVEWIFLGVSVVLAAVLYFLGLRGDEAFPIKLSLGAVVLLLIGVALLRFEERTAQEVMPMAWFAFAQFILMLFGMNLAGLKDSMHNVKGTRPMRMPRGMRSKNLLITGLFILLALLVALFPPLQSLIAASGRLIIRFIKWFFSLFISDEPSPPAVTEILETEPPPPGPVAEQGPVNPLVATYFIIMGIAGVVLVVLLIFGGTLIKNRDKLSRFFRRRSRSEEAYDDEVERISTLRDALRRRGRELRDRMAAMARRKERFEDMDTPARKVRFAYKTLLKRRGGRTSQTPLEVCGAQPSEKLQALGKTYSALKYGDRQADDTAAAVAAEAMGEIKKIRTEKD